MDNTRTLNLMRLVPNRLPAGVSLRTETMDGREYLVAPVIAVREQVLNGILTLADELTAVIDAWNGVPIVLYHPLDKLGDAISAGSPDVWRKQGIGRLYNVKWVDNGLHGEMWLDVAKCIELGGEAADILDRIRNGKVVEVSTGYMANIDDLSGSVDGQDFNGVARDIVPDHLAVLPSQVGACSVRDGCGVPRINNLITNEGHMGIMVALFVPGDVAGSLALNTADLPDGATAVEPSGLHLTLGYMGKTDEAAFSQQELLQVVGDFARHNPIVQGVIGGIGRFNQAEDGDTNAFYASFDCPYIPCFRKELIEDLREEDIPVNTEHGFTPHITLAYIPSSAPTPAYMPERMPIVFPFISVAWGDQVTHFQLQGIPANLPTVPSSDEPTAVTVNHHKENLMDLIEEVFQEEDTTPVEEMDQPETAVTELQTETVVNADEQDGGEEDAPAVAPEPMIPLAQVEAMIAAALEPYQQSLATLQANAQRQRATLVNEIMAAPNIAFTREELETVDDLILNRLAQTLSVPDYSGQVNGRMQTNTQGDEWEVIETPAGWERQ